MNITVKNLMRIEEILLKLNSEHRFDYSLGELIKSDKYIKEIGEITDLFFNIQIEYSESIKNINTPEYEKKLLDYNSRLFEDTVDVDVQKYISFIESVKPKVKKQEYIKAIEQLTANKSFS